MFDPKKIAVGIVAKMPKPGARMDRPNPDMPKGDGEEMDHEEALTAASHEAMDALHAKDAEGFKRALMSFFQVCDAMPHEEGEHEEEEDDGQPYHAGGFPTAGSSLGRKY